MKIPITRDPFLSDPTLRTVYVVYALFDYSKCDRHDCADDPTTCVRCAMRQWVLAGFIRRKTVIRRPRTANQRFAGIRQKLGIRRDTPVALVDLATAQHNVRETGQGVSHDQIS